MRRAGFSLLEMLIVMIVLGMILALSASLVFGVLATYRADADLAHRMLRQDELGDRFREDVAGAVSAPVQAADMAAGPQCLLLQRPDKSLIVYRAGPSGLERLEISGKHSAKATILHRDDETAIEFSRSAAKERSITLRLKERAGPRGTGERLLEFTGALGGDLR